MIVVYIYSLSGCKHCRRAKTLLDAEKLEYIDINVEKHPTAREEMIRLSGGRTTVPQVFINNEHIGGADETSALVSSGEFRRRVEAAVAGGGAGGGDGWPTLPDDGDDGGVEEEGILGVACEEDKYLGLVDRMAAADGGGVRLKKKKKKGIFEGRDAIEWLRREVEPRPSEDEAARMLSEMLVLRHFVRDGDGDDANFDAASSYRWLRSVESRALNSGALSDCAPPPAAQLAEDLRRVILALYDEVLSPDGRYVDYAAIPQARGWPDYLAIAQELQRVALHGLSRPEKLAFFINVYNVMVIHAIIERGAPGNLLQRYRFFSGITMRIGGHEFSLQDIENGVLRGNKKGIAQLKLPFSKDDPRAPIALPAPEPRIHMAISCASASCPSIRTFKAENIEKDLDTCVTGFVQDPGNFRMDRAHNTVHLSKIFKWYSSDFGKNHAELLEWIARFLPDAGEQKALLSMAETAKVLFNKYDWTTNNKKK